MNQFLALIITLAVTSVFANDVTYNLASSTQPGVTNKITFELPTNYHFNKDAPSAVYATNAKGEWIKAPVLKNEKQRFVAEWTEKVDTCHIRAKLYVCDDKETFCRPDTKEFACDKGKFVSSPWNDGAAVLRASNTHSSEAEKLFIVNDPQKALELAKKTKKPLLIDFLECGARPAIT